MQITGKSPQVIFALLYNFAKSRQDKWKEKANNQLESELLKEPKASKTAWKIAYIEAEEGDQTLIQIEIH